MLSSKMSYVEEVNDEVCQKLAKLSFKQFTQFYEFSEIDESGNKDTIVSQYNMLVNYCKLQIQNNYKLNIDYKYANNKESGRIFVKQTIGLQRIWNKFRGILCNGITNDLDMINAHPSILLYLCKLHNIDCENLENYVNSRKYFLDSLMKTDKLTKDEAKILFICSMNSEDPILSHYVKKKEVQYKNEFYIKYDAEMKLIQNKFYDIYQLEAKEIEKKTKTNIKGKLLNSIMCKYENEILQKAMTILNDISCNVQVPMFDGCMCIIKNHPIQTVINTLDKLTIEYGIKWSHKLHNTEILDKLNEMTFDDNVLNFIGDNESEVANFVLTTLLKNKLFNCNGDIFLYTKPVWTNKDVSDLLFKVLTPHEFYIDKPQGPVLVNKNTASLKSLITMIINLAESKPDFYKIMHKDTQYRLFYRNGYYDFKQSKFIDYNDNHIPFTTFIIDRDYKPNNTLYDAVFEKVFYPIFNVELDEHNKPIDIESDNYKVMKYTIYQLARKLAGHIEDKTWMFFLGGRNSGKGIIERSVSNTFNPYVVSFNSSNLISKKTLGEISKELAWMVDFEFSRLIFGSEIDQKLDKTGRNDIKFNGRLIKSIMSGGDELECRLNHKDARKFQIQSSIVLCANDIPTCEPVDALDFMQRIDMPCRFINDDMFNKLSSCEKMTFIRKLPDMDLKEWLKLEEVHQAIEFIMFEAYKTVIPYPSSLIVSDDSNDIESAESKLLQIFNITETDDTNMLSNEKITEYMAKHHIAMSLIKATKILKLNGAIPFRTKFKRGLGCIKYVGGDDL